MKAFAIMILFAIHATAFAETPLPAHVDWRSAGAVTPVSDQGQCGADYAFAAIAALEGANKIAAGHAVKLSEQELIDCSVVYGNHGCNGGTPDHAFEWIVQHGIAGSFEYPYHARDGQCRQQTRPSVHLAGFQAVSTDLASLMKAVARQPVAALIDASDPDFQQYDGGVYGCHAQNGNHWIAIVGYGTTASGQPYWIIKNSQGAGWGESGYMRLTRSEDCKNIFAAVAPKI
jgi:C1A family cysteine protease